MGVFYATGMSQDLEAEAKKLRELKNAPKQMLQEGIKVSGGISSNTTFYTTNAVESPGRLPFESILSGNMTFDFFGKIKMPFSFTFNSQNINFKSPFDERLRLQRPFNRFQFRPTYKGLTVLLGVSSLSFSPYTLNGHRFEGVGVQYKPKSKPYYASFIYGLLQKSVLKDTLAQTVNNRPSYQRNAWGVQLGYKSKSGYLGEISILRSVDQISSLPYAIDEIAFPEANAVIGIKGAASIYKKINLKVDMAYSGITKDLRGTSLERPSEGTSFVGLLPSNTTTSFKKALKTGLEYGGQRLKAAIEYSRVDPEYRTHGAYYFVNDLENIALNTTTIWLENRLTVNATLGRQRNNLAESPNLQTLWQWVGSSNITFAPNEKTMLNVNYSTFQSYTNLRSDLEYLTSIGPYAGLDTLNYRQINQSLQVLLMKQLPNSTKEHLKSIQTTAMYQGSSNQQGSQSNSVNVTSLNLQYSNQWKERKRNFMAGISINRNDLVIRSEWFIGPTASFQKAFLQEKMQLQSSLNYLKTTRSTSQSGDVLNLRASLGFAPSKEHQFNLGVLSMYRNLNPGRASERDFWDMTLTLGYQYKFQAKLWSLNNPKEEKKQDKLSPTR
jgi:hypothetical protein